MILGIEQNVFLTLDKKSKKWYSNIERTKGNIMAGDIFTLDENNNAAVRTVGVNGIVESNKPDIFTEDENGNAAIRVVGSGGVDENKVIVKSDTIPEASADELGKFYCYSGETNSSFTHGYVYECVEGSSYYVANIAFEQSTFASESFEKAGQLVVDAGVVDPTEVVGGTMTYALAGNLWTIVFTDENGNALNTGYSIYTDDLEQDYDILPVIDPSDFVDGQVVNMTINNVSEEQGYLWERIDLQPAAKLGRYLSGWNCATGLAVTNPSESPYEYTTGDYFIVSAVATGGGTNYRPNGSSYVIGQASTTVETNSVVVNDTYLYDGTNWTLLKTGSAVSSVNGQTGDVTITESDILPSQTDNSGKFLTTDGTNASWSDKPLVNNAQQSTSVAIVGEAYGANKTNAVVVGYAAGSGGSGVNANYTVCIGAYSKSFNGSVSIGYKATSSSKANCVVIGTEAMCNGDNAALINTSGVSQNNYKKNTFAFANTNGLYELISADGTMPTDRFTTSPVADGSYVPTLTISSGTPTRTWAAAASAPVVPSTMPELTVAGWSSNTQTVNVTGVTANNIVFVSPAPASAADYADAGIVCTAQGSGTLTFTCTTVPSNNITVNVVILG